MHNTTIWAKWAKLNPIQKIEEINLYCKDRPDMFCETQLWPSWESQAKLKSKLIKICWRIQDVQQACHYKCISASALFRLYDCQPLSRQVISQSCQTVLESQISQEEDDFVSVDVNNKPFYEALQLSNTIQLYAQRNISREMFPPLFLFRLEHKRQCCSTSHRLKQNHACAY